MLIVDGRHPSVQAWSDAFEHSHLPEGKLRELMAAYHGLAQALVDLLPDGPRLVDALHDVWRSKNEAVFFAVQLGKRGAE